MSRVYLIQVYDHGGWLNIPMTVSLSLSWCQGYLYVVNDWQCDKLHRIVSVGPDVPLLVVKETP